jgi:uncharacterized cysteine cluster protein YcgN (CxxCxxCC family)
MTTRPFWQLPLDQLTTAEWDQLCDGCARCCLHKLEDEDSGEVYYTRIACSRLDIDTCRCTAYAERAQVEPECAVISRDNLAALDYLPETCAYRLRHAGLPLPPWHPLLSGDAQSVHRAGISVRAYALPLSAVPDPDDLEDYIIDTP